MESANSKTPRSFVIDNHEEFVFKKEKVIGRFINEQEGLKIFGGPEFVEPRGRLALLDKFQKLGLKDGDVIRPKKFKIMEKGNCVIVKVEESFEKYNTDTKDWDIYYLDKYGNVISKES